MNTHGGWRRWLLVVVASVLGVALGTSARAASTFVVESGNQFVKAQVTVGLGDTVTWTNQDSAQHSVTFDDGSYSMPAGCQTGVITVGCQTQGQNVSRLFQTAGTFPYHCKIHGAAGGRGMSGVVVVTAAGTSSTLASSTTTTTGKGASSTTTSSTAKVTSSTTSTTRLLATSSTVVKSTTTSSGPATSVLEPGAAPSFTPDDSATTATGSAAGGRKDGGGGGGSGTAAVIAGLLLVVSAGGGFLLWRLRPGRS